MISSYLLFKNNNQNLGIGGGPACQPERFKKLHQVPQAFPLCERIMNREEIEVVPAY